MELTMEFAPVAAITALCFLAGMGWRLGPWDNKWIPLVCGALGMALGLVCFIFTPLTLPAGDPLTAAATGMASGFAATGLHQTGKQLTEGAPSWSGR